MNTQPATRRDDWPRGARTTAARDLAPRPRRGDTPEADTAPWRLGTRCRSAPDCLMRSWLPPPPAPRSGAQARPAATAPRTAAPRPSRRHTRGLAADLGRVHCFVCNRRLRASRQSTRRCGARSKTPIPPILRSARRRLPPATRVRARRLAAEQWRLHRFACAYRLRASRASTRAIGARSVTPAPSPPIRCRTTCRRRRASGGSCRGRAR